MPRCNRWLAVALGWLVVAGVVRAQPEIPASPPLLPPPPSPVPALITAAEPSKPAIESITFEDTPAPVAKEDECCIYFGTDGTEYLLWWLKSGPLPPLVARNRSGPPVLGSTDTRLIAGGEPASYDPFSGGRFTIGSRLNDAPIGTEFTYFFLGTRTMSLSDGSAGGNVGRPIVNATTGAETFLPVSGPSVRGGMFSATSSARAQGVEANVVANLYHDECRGLTGLVGYRYLQIQEGVFVGQVGNLVTAGGATPFTLGDQFDTSNRFHGSQIGLRADARKGPLFVEMVGKIAFGQTTEVVRINGVTGFSPTAVTSGGLLAVASNSGRVERDAFAVLPEAGIKFGCGDEKQRLFVGYNFMYLSDAVRPGDQIDRTVNVGQVPLLGGSGSFAGPDRPRLTGKATDLWLQGLMFGFETKW